MAIKKNGPGCCGCGSLSPCYLDLGFFDPCASYQEGTFKGLLTGLPTHYENYQQFGVANWHTPYVVKSAVDATGQNLIANPGANHFQTFLDQINFANLSRFTFPFTITVTGNGDPSLTFGPDAVTTITEADCSPVVIYKPGNPVYKNLLNVPPILTFTATFYFNLLRVINGVVGFPPQVVGFPSGIVSSANVSVGGSITNFTFPGAPGGEPGTYRGTSLPLLLTVASSVSAATGTATINLLLPDSHLNYVIPYTCNYTFCYYYCRGKSQGGNLFPVDGSRDGLAPSLGYNPDDVEGITQPNFRKNCPASSYGMSAQPMMATAEIPPEVASRPIIDRPANLSKELVVARYREDVRWVESSPVFVTVYDKGHTPAGLGGSTRVVPLRNRGREGRTWLTHILDHWSDLADWTFFAQAEPHQAPQDYLARLGVDYPDTTGLTSEYMPHFPPQRIKDEDVVEWHGGHEVRYGRAIYQGGRTKVTNEPWLREVWGKFFICPPPEPLAEWTYSYGAMYAVPRHRIRARPLAFWRWCHRIIADPENQAEHSWGSGYAFEILWRYLFGDADRYPVRLPELDRSQLSILVDLCEYGSGECGCGSGPPRLCSHPDRPNAVRREDCLACVSQSLNQGP